MQRLISYLVFFIMGLFAFSCLAQPLKVVTSFSILGDIVKNVGGKQVHVTSLVGPNGDPHEFQPSPKESELLANANLVFINGLGLEGWLSRLIKASGYQGPVVVVSQGLDPQKMQDDGKMITDPHAWNSLKNGILYAQNITNALIKADPQQTAYFQQQSQTYIQQLTALDKQTQQRFSAIPANKRKVLTSHDAFGYFSAEYHVTFLSPVGYSTTAQPSAQAVAALIRQIKQQGIRDYFIENQTDPRLIRQIAKATGAKPGGELYPEALTDANGIAPSYIAAFKHNVDTLIASMQ